MFARQLKLKQARHALRDGRLEEAFRIVMDRSVREHRGAQELLDELVTPLLKRASDHLIAGRLEDALIDVERAIEAGGNRPEASQQRQAVLAALHDRKAQEKHNRDLLQSARRHLDNGNLHATRDRLERAPDDAAVTGLRQQAVDREREGASALTRARLHLERKEILEAVDAAQSLILQWGRNDETHALLADLKTPGTRALLAAFEGGDLRLAITLHQRLRAVLDDSVALRRFDDALDLSLRAQRSFSAAEFDEARTLLGRLDKLFPGVIWIVDALGDLTSVSDGLRSLRTGPLGDLDRQTTNAHDLNAETPNVAILNREGTTGMDQIHEVPTPHGAECDRYLLWIDGLGTFLILLADRISIGRVGSTARADLELTADLAGYHAEISRSGEDYFVVSVQGDVRVGGKKVQKRLLTHDDALDLGSKCRVRFGQPTGMSATALLELRKGLHIEGDVKTIVLLDDNLIIGPGANSHIQSTTLEDRFLIQKGKDGLRCRAEKDIVVDGDASGVEVEIQPGSRLQIEDLTFTVTGVRDQATSS